MDSSLVVRPSFLSGIAVPCPPCNTEGGMAADRPRCPAWWPPTSARGAGPVRAIPPVTTATRSASAAIIAAEAIIHRPPAPWTRRTGRPRSAPSDDDGEWRRGSRGDCSGRRHHRLPPGKRREEGGDCRRSIDIDPAAAAAAAAAAVGRSMPTPSCG